MDFFSKLGKKASETYNAASEKTGKLAKEAKLRMKMNENKSKINEIYAQIGQKVYERHTTNGEINIKKDLEEECTRIDVLSAEIETCLKEIMLLKDKKQCVKCFSEIEKDANFCNKCGAKQPEIIQTSNEEVAKEVEIVQEPKFNPEEDKKDDVQENNMQDEKTEIEKNDDIEDND